MIERSGNRVAVTVPMTIANARALEGQGGQLAAELAGDELVVDLGAVHEVDSAALAILFAWQRDLQSRGGRMRLENVPAAVSSLAAMYGVTDLIPAAA